jgi:hypothetical protein
MKFIKNKVVFFASIIYFFSNNALASCVTGFACADSNTCTVTTICHSFNPYPFQNNIISQIPINSYGGPGLGYVPPAAKAASIASCRNAFSQARIRNCQIRILDTHTSNIATCNTGINNAIVSRGIAGTGIAGGFATIQIGGPFAFGIILYSTYVYVKEDYNVAYYSGACKDEANAKRDKELLDCPIAPKEEIAALAQACK